jgi:hypothetical protein
LEVRNWQFEAAPSGHGPSFPLQVHIGHFLQEKSKAEALEKSYINALQQTVFSCFHLFLTTACTDESTSKTALHNTRLRFLIYSENAKEKSEFLLRLCDSYGVFQCSGNKKTPCAPMEERGEKKSHHRGLFPYGS